MTAESAPKLDLDSECLARDYEEVSATRQFESGKDLLARLGIAPAERVLAVGCGTGPLARHLADLVGPAGMVLGLDPLPRRIELVLRRGGRLGISTGLKGYRTPLQEAMMAALREPPFDAHSRARESIVFRVDTVQMRALLEASGFEPARVEVVETEQRFLGGDRIALFRRQLLRQCLRASPRGAQAAGVRPRPAPAGRDRRPGRSRFRLQGRDGPAMEREEWHRDCPA